MSTMKGTPAKVDYESYLRSPEWNEKREERLALDGYRCVRCGSEESLEVHHLNYGRLGCEKMGDLESLCGDCHAIAHKLQNGGSFHQHKSRQQKYRKIFISTYGPFPHPCFFCGEEVLPWSGRVSSTSPAIHHLDEDKNNNHPSNLTPAHHGCHTGYHERKRWKDPEYRERRRTHTQSRWEDPEYRAKMIAINTGREVSIATREKIRTTHQLPEVKAKHSASVKKAQGAKTPEERKAIARSRMILTSCTFCRRELTVTQLTNHQKSCRNCQICGKLYASAAEAKGHKCSRYLTRICQGCGKEFKPSREPNARYCSSVCWLKTGKARDSEEISRNTKALWQDPEYVAKMAARTIPRVSCVKCHRELGTNNIKKHQAWCVYGLHIDTLSPEGRARATALVRNRASPTEETREKIRQARANQEMPPLQCQYCRRICNGYGALGMHEKACARKNSPLGVEATHQDNPV